MRGERVGIIVRVITHKRFKVCKSRNGKITIPLETFLVTIPLFKQAPNCVYTLVN